MKSFTETEIKYLAGLLDADGSLSFKFCPSSSGKTFLYLSLALTASESIDKQGYVKSLGDRAGTVCKVVYEKESYTDAWKWHVQKRSELNMLLPRLLKHMVVKATHWEWLFRMFTENKGKDITDEVGRYKELSVLSRSVSGPLKHKKHPTWAWTAGYLDGDGCYTLSKKNILHVSCITHKDDLDGVQLLHKAFGGSIYEPRDDNTVLWRRGLGKTNRDFALKFLSKMVQHSHLKRWKIEQMLAFHNQSQRLSDNCPKG